MGKYNKDGGEVEVTTLRDDVAKAEQLFSRLADSTVIDLQHEILSSFLKSGPLNNITKEFKNVTINLGKNVIVVLANENGIEAEVSQASDRIRESVERMAYQDEIVLPGRLSLTDNLLVLLLRKVIITC